MWLVHSGHRVIVFFDLSYGLISSVLPIQIVNTGAIEIC